MLSNVVGRIGKWEYDFGDEIDENEEDVPQCSLEEADKRKRECREAIHEYLHVLDKE